MRKLSILIIIFITLTNVSYASFPITENIKSIEKVEDNIRTVDSPTNETPMGSWSLLMGLSWIPLIIIGALMMGEGDGEWGYGLSELGLVAIIAGGVCFIGAIITGVKSLRRGETPKWKAIIGIALTAGWIILSILSAAIELFGEYTY